MTKVALLGAAGGIGLLSFPSLPAKAHTHAGQPLALLLKSNPLVSHLSLYDLVAVPGVAADLSHINTNSKARSPYPVST
jgi:malate dehydrogenase